MRAVTFSRFGGPEVMEVAQLPDPRPGPREIRVRVRAATVNPTDTGLRSGLRRRERLKDHTPPYVVGMELAGVVDAVGADVDWRIGDEVMAIAVPARPTGGAQAELVVVPATSAARIPTGASFVEAATLPMNGLTARLALDLAELAPGATLAVTGAAGTLGGYVVQLAKLDGLRVIADSSPADEELVRSFGPDVIVPRGPGVAEDIRQAVPEGVDGLVDAAVMGGPVLPAVRDGGVVLAVRDFEGETERDITIHRVSVATYAENRAALEQLGRLAGSGELTLRVAGTYPPEEAPDAHRRLEAGGVRGRLVLCFPETSTA